MQKLALMSPLTNKLNRTRQGRELTMWVSPLLMFVFASTTLIGGSLSFSETNAGVPLETYWLFLFLLSLVFFSLTLRVERDAFYNDYVESSFEIHWICLALLAMSTALFLWKGAPLLSGNPNIARVKFFEGGALLSKAFYALPLVIVIGIVKGEGSKGTVFRLYALLAVLQMILAGNKAALINAAFALVLGFWCARKKIPLKVIVFGSFATIAVTLFLFSKVTNSSEVNQSPLELLKKRAFVSNAVGLRACVANADSYGPAPALKGFQSVSDRIGGYSKGYPISTGRYLATAIYKYPHFYAPVWELTVTGYCDSLLLGGLVGALAFSVLMALIAVLVTNRMFTSASTLNRALLAFLLYQLLALYSGGNFAAQLLGFVGQSWFLIGAILLSGKLLSIIRQQFNNSSKKPINS